MDGCQCDSVPLGYYSKAINFHTKKATIFLTAGKLRLRDSESLVGAETMDLDNDVLEFQVQTTVEHETDMSRFRPQCKASETIRLQGERGAARGARELIQ
jgi:hypothetical protein